MEHARAKAPSRADVRRASRVGLLVAVAHFFVALFLARDFGPTWDAVKTEYPYGEAFLGCILNAEPNYFALRFDPKLEQRAPHPDFSLGRLPWYASWPLASLFGAAACQLFWTELGWIQPLVAHNLAAILPTSLLIWLLVRWVGARFGLTSGLAAVLFLLSSPRFVAHSFNNLKDAPEVFLYFATACAFFAALRSRSGKDWAGAGVLLGLALAQRPNALFLPWQILAFLVIAIVFRRRRSEASCVVLDPKHLPLAVALFALTYWLAVPALWLEPIVRLREQADFYFRSTELLRGEGAFGWGAIEFAAVRRVLWTTPTVLLVCALVGVLRRDVPFEERLFLGLGVCVPIARTALPGMRDYDGVRHYLEFYPFLCGLAALGAGRLAEAASASLADGRKLLFTQACVVGVLILPGAWQTVGTYPNGICYFNGLVGGLSGARERRIRGGDDYWGNSYWQGLAWVSQHAGEGATLVVPGAEHVALCAAPVRLREDVVFPPSVGDAPPRELIVMRNSRPFAPHSTTFRALEGQDPELEILVQGAPILHVYRFRGERAAEMFGIWRDAEASYRSSRRLFQWINDDRERLKRLVVLWRTQGKPAALEELRRIAPEELLGEVGEVLRFGLGLDNEPGPK